MPYTGEQRKHARLDIALSVSYAVQKTGGEVSEIAEAKSSDISAGGLRLMTVGPIENGSLINLEIALPEENVPPINAKGEVVWQNKISDYSYETGAVIKFIEEEDKTRFLKFVFDQMTQLVSTTHPSLH